MPLAIRKQTIILCALGSSTGALFRSFFVEDRTGQLKIEIRTNDNR